MKYKSTYQIALLLILAIIILAVQITFLDSFNLFWRSWNLILISLVLLVNLVNLHKTSIFLIFCGLVLDIYSSLPFGLFLSILFITAIILEILFVNFFTNRSFYSLIFMGWLAVVIYNILFFLGVSLLYVLGVTEFFLGVSFWWGLLYQVLTSTIALWLCFWALNSFTNLFKPIFIKS